MRRQDWAILLAAWLLVAIGVVVAIVLLRPNPGSVQAIPTSAPPTVAPTYTVEYEEATARRLYPLAETEAKGWEPDVELAGASAVWPQTAVNLVGNPVQWQFRFYSPSRNYLYFVSVTPDGQVSGGPHFRSETRPPVTISAADWQVDSAQALARWLDSGGGEFLGQNPGVQVIAQLGFDPAKGRPVWNVAGLDDTGEKYWAAFVDAGTGQVSLPVVE